MRRWMILLTGAILLLSIACSVVAVQETQVDPAGPELGTPETAIAAEGTVSPGADSLETTAAAEPTSADGPAAADGSAAQQEPSPEQPALPWPEPVEEAVRIIEPGAGSRVVSPLHLSGEADPTFEQTLVVRLVRADGSLMLEQPLQIDAYMGERGAFEADLPFSVGTAENVLIQVLDISARDGGIVHLSSTAVTLIPSGLAEIRDGQSPYEQLQILRPVPGETIEGGVILVEGFGLASFENTLVVEVYNAAGERVGLVPTMTSAQELGEPGWFSVEVEYNVSLEGPGRVSVVDPLPVFDGLGHVASVPVMLIP